MIYFFKTAAALLAYAEETVVDTRNTPALNEFCRESNATSLEKQDLFLKHNFSCLCNSLEPKAKQTVENFILSLHLMSLSKRPIGKTFKNILKTIHDDLKVKFDTALSTALCLEKPKVCGTRLNLKDEFVNFVHSNIHQKTPEIFFSDYTQFILNYIIKTYGKRLSKVRIANAVNAFKSFFSVFDCSSKEICVDEVCKYLSDEILVTNETVLSFINNMMDLLENK